MAKKKYEELENQGIRDEARDKGVYLYEVAKEIGISAYSLSRWLSVPVTKSQELQIRRAIKDIYERKYVYERK